MQAAIKFYLDRTGFERERELYTESQLKEMMPATLAVEDNASGNCQTPYGYTFPPFVIIERGQSLDEWARDNANKDFITIFQVQLQQHLLRISFVCLISNEVWSCLRGRHVFDCEALSPCAPRQQLACIQACVAPVCCTHFESGWVNSLAVC